jgi:hypothetical protein
MPNSPAAISAALESAMAAAAIVVPGPTPTNGTSVVLPRVLAAYANTAAAWVWQKGYLVFFASLDHASVTNYQARLRVNGSGTVIGTLDMGQPTPDVYGTIGIDATSLLAGHTGSHTMSVATTTAGGTTDSSISSPFTLPL